MCSINSADVGDDSGDDQPQGSTSFIAKGVDQQNDSILNNLHYRMDFGPSRDTGGCTIHDIRIMGGADKSSRSTVDASHHNQFRSTIPAQADEVVECATTLSPATKPGPDETEHKISLEGKPARSTLILPAGLRGEVRSAGAQSSGIRQMQGRPGGSSRNSVPNDKSCCIEAEASLKRSREPKARIYYIHWIIGWFDFSGD